MEYSPHFDICAIVFSFLIVLMTLIKPRLRSPRNAAFLFFVVMTALSSVAEIVFYTGFFSRNSQSVPAALLNTASNFYTLLSNYTAFALCVYIIALTNDGCGFGKAMRRKGFAAAVFLPISVLTVLVALNFFVPLLGHFDDVKDFNPGIRILRFAAAVYYGLFAVVYLIVKRKSVKRSVIGKLSLIVISALIPILFWAIVPGLKLMFFAVSIMALLIFFIIGSPELNIEPVSGLLNRDSFLLASEMLYSKKTPFSAVMVSFANSPTVTKTLGAPFVKELTKLSSDYFRRIKPRGTELFSLSGNRCCFLMKKASEKEARALASKIIKRFRSDFICRGIPVTVHANVMIAVCPDDADSVERLTDLVAVSDDAFIIPNVPLMAKTLAFTEINERNFEIERLLRSSVEKDDFTVLYQPIYETRTGMIVGAEALARFSSDSIGCVMPEEFLPIAEKIGMIMKIGYMVFDDVCRMLSLKNITKGDIDYIQIGLSMVQCLDAGLAERLIEMADKYEIDRKMISFEITETTASNHSEAIVTNMAMLYSAGFHIVLDDYGIGDTNMRNLIDLPIDTIKLDRSLVWTGGVSEKAHIVLESIIKMANGLDMRVVAEGVETERHEKMLADMDCGYLQGFYFSVPLNEADFLEKLFVQNGTAD